MESCFSHMSSQVCICVQPSWGQRYTTDILAFTQEGRKIAENILRKGVLFNSQTDDGVPIFHGSAGTGLYNHSRYV